MSALRSAAWSGLGFVALYLICVRTAAGQRLDGWVMIWASATSGSHAWATLLLWWVSELTVLLAAAMLVVTTATLRGGRVAIGAALTVGSVVVAAQVLKEVLSRPLLTEGISNSFPSGHVAAVAGLAAAAVIALAPRFRWWAVGLLLPAVGLTGVATIVLEWHRPSDVVGSVLLAVTLASLASLLTDRTPSAPHTHEHSLAGRSLAKV